MDNGCPDERRKTLVLSTAGTTAVWVGSGVSLMVQVGVMEGVGVTVVVVVGLW